MGTGRHLLAIQINNPPMNHGGGGGGLWVAVVMVTGLALIVYGVAPSVRFRIWREQALKATGWIIDNVPQASGPRETAWLPMVEFQAEGETIVSLPGGPSRPQGWPIGSPVEVLYDPADPRHTRLADTRYPISVAAIVGLGLIAFLFVVAS
jgi:hypothetical protein